MNYKLITVDEQGRPYYREPLEGGSFLQSPDYVEIHISEDVSKFMDSMCDIEVHNGGTKVYILNNQRFIKELMFINNSLTSS